MSEATRAGPGSQQPSGASGCVAVAVVLMVLLVMALGCAGLGAGLFFVYRSAETPIWQAPGSIPLPGRASPQSANDWMTSRTLAPVYTTALDAVAADQSVIEQLGDAIEPVQREDSNELFRRRDEKTIEFDIRGPKGTALVSVVASVAQNGESRVTKISVKLSDGSIVDVPPPETQPAFSPVR